MTLEAESEFSSVYADDYAWHDFLTERDFRPEDLWEFDCEARSTGTPGPHPEYPVQSCPAPSSEDSGADDAKPSAEDQPQLSQLVWELVASTPDDDGADGDPNDDDGAGGHGACPPSHGTDDGGTDSDPARAKRSGAHPNATVSDDDGIDSGPAGAARGARPKEPDAGLTGRVVLTGLETLDLNETSDALKDLAGLRSWVDAMEARIVSQLAELTHDDVSPRFPAGNRGEELARSVAASEVALTLNVPERTAARLVDESVHFTVKHAATLEALQSGSISRRHAVLIADESLGMPGDAVAQFERALLDQATRMTVPKLARRARRLREAHHPETLPIRKAKAVTERHVEMQPDDDGMAWLHAYLPAEQACGIYQRLTATARKLKMPDEPRTLAQLRADVFTDLLTHSCITGGASELLSADGRNSSDSTAQGGGEHQGKGRTGAPTHREEPAWQGITAHVNITVPVLALLDVLAGGANELGSNTAGANSAPADTNAARDNNAADTAADTDTDTNVGTHIESRSDPNNAAGSTLSSADAVPRARGLNQFAELEGYGPIDAETAARLAAHAPSFTRILTHPVTGSVLDVGRETYRPPKHLQDWVRARDRTCRHPGCNRAAVSCEIDHTVPWARGGTTSHCNLACFCAKHHMYKSEGIFGYRQPAPGTIVVRTRAGTVRTSDPDPPF